MAVSKESSVTRYKVTGMDCASCAAKIEAAVSKVDGVARATVSISSGEMEHVASSAASKRAAEIAVSDLGYHVQQFEGDATGSALSTVTPAYKRALWIVVILNVGFGVIEIVGGFYSESQALKADALDFIGDGIISWIGLIAVGWGLAARARAARLQGFFLVAMGVGVVIAAIYRTFAVYHPDAEVMGILGAVGFVVNVAAAVVLIPHRHGDANARAVWLFSRNDALSNVAVIIAAGLVAFTGSHWPDLAVGGIIALLFLHSAMQIIRHARRDLKRANALNGS
jgi:Co/Zn/Cd efflux system component